MLGRRQQSNGSGAGRWRRTSDRIQAGRDGGASGSLRIDGHVDGEIQAEGDVVVGRDGPGAGRHHRGQRHHRRRSDRRVQASGRLELWPRDDCTATRYADAHRRARRRAGRNVPDGEGRAAVSDGALNGAQGG